MLSLNNVKDLIDAKPEDVKISIDELGIDLKLISEEAYKEALVDHLKNVYKERLLRDSRGDAEYEEFLKVSQLYYGTVDNKVKADIARKYPKYFSIEYYSTYYPSEHNRIDNHKYSRLSQGDLVTVLTDKIMESIECLNFSKR